MISGPIFFYSPIIVFSYIFISFFEERFEPSFPSWWHSWFLSSNNEYWIHQCWRKSKIRDSTVESGVTYVSSTHYLAWLPVL